MQVNLIDHTSDPILSLYIAFRVAASALTPQQILTRIDDERITRERMVDYVQERFKETGHTSPLEQVWFEFIISGVSRSFSHQFVRHHMGISFEQQSQRIVSPRGPVFDYVVPKTVIEAGFENSFRGTMAQLLTAYRAMTDAGVPAEDARFVLPNAAATNFKVVVNLQELLHIADQRLCVRAQWEFRQVVARMRGEVFRRWPEIGRLLAPKCMAHRLGYCDESYEAWSKCPIGLKRPHKTDIIPA